jgi:hypothetical protein
MTSPHHHPKRLALATATLLLLCAGFGWWQAAPGRVGGPMSTAKVLWLFLALTHFFLVPFWLWRDQGLSPAWRRVWGLFLAGFVIRAVIEIPMLLLTRAWRCEHGIAHDAVMLGLLMWCMRKIPRDDQKEIRFIAWLTGLVLIFEATNAWLFREIGNPAAGIYFASNEEQFRMINRITWSEIAVVSPLFLVWLARYVRSRR